MLKKLLKLYVMAMTGEVYSPVPHLFGPPGSGKSTIVAQAADLLGVKLHTINVSRISPLELEGVQMPSQDSTKLNLLTATFWTQLNDGDILLFDEFLRGFPEVYNGLLDIMTSRQVGGFQLPKVFILAASNSTVAYDKALEDRLLHLPIEDPRTSSRARKRLGKLFVQEVGLLPSLADSFEVDDMLNEEVLPTFEIMDQLEKRAGLTAAASAEGTSLRNLIGQAKLREVHSEHLKEVLKVNNLRSARESKPQYIILYDYSAADQYSDQIRKLYQVQDKLTDIQRTNFLLNMQFVELFEQEQQLQQEKGKVEDDEEIFID